MSDYEIDHCSRRCTATGRELKPGEAYYSLLRWRDRQMIREDYATEAWQEPPADALGWWRSRVPEAHSSRRQWAPQDVMLHVLETRLADPAARDFCFVLALLLIRRRIVRLAAEEADGQQQPWLVLFAPLTETEYRVPVVQPHATRVQEIEAELSAVLGAGSGTEPTTGHQA